MFQTMMFPRLPVKTARGERLGVRAHKAGWSVRLDSAWLGLVWPGSVRLSPQFVFLAFFPIFFQISKDPKHWSQFGKLDNRRRGCQVPVTLAFSFKGSKII
jgi:hypothetical protein